MTHPAPYKLVAVVGSTSAASRTRVLVESIAEALAALVPLEVQTLEIGELAPHIGSAFSRDGMGQPGRAAIEAIENADLLIAATPVYKGSYSGLFKHLIDFVHPEALVGRPVILAASGGSPRHALVVDQQLRPLFSFFRALTMPSAVYACEADFEGYSLHSAALIERVRETALQAAQALKAAAREAQPLLEAA